MADHICPWSEKFDSPSRIPSILFDLPNPGRPLFGPGHNDLLHRRCHLLRKVLEIKLSEINNLARQSTSAATSKLLLIKTSTDQVTLKSPERFRLRTF
ncbi:unnamed protein product [Oikopleura dioica]|uniref:Uncharacterized protein n=1 Tax=Oikopleura dioica TaxID=34765 RepID=E4XJ95_OIKDI|nr:unnamed protein product [Oikopleura dioica]CBY37483.1 unnamed protein product [Oikopleura dioica]